MSAQPFRLASGGMIDRSRPLSFTFDGRRFTGFAGDTLASALLANGVTLTGRSFKYHRPRGILSAGSEEPCALVEMRQGARREPNTRATVAELHEGLEAASQNRWPSLNFDLLSVNQLIAPFLTAGFYYKTFMWPSSFWEPVYEKFIRRSAGLGRAATEPDPDTYEHGHKHCDVLIAGGGPAGIAAALSAAASGARVVLCEEDAWFGGALSPERDVIDGMPAQQWVEAGIARLGALDNVTLMARTTAFAYFDGNVITALERVNDHVPVPPPHQPRQRLWAIRTKQVVLACGSHERPMIFANNDKPGVMLSRAVRQYAERFAVIPGRQAAIVTNNDDSYRTAMALHEAGTQIAIIADARTGMSEAAERAAGAGIRVVTGTVPARARGGRQVQAVDLAGADGSILTIDCDLLAMSGGFSPDVNLASQTGAAPVWDEALHGFVPAAPIRAERSAGAGRGVFDLKGCLEDGHEAGLAAALAAGLKPGRPLAAPKAAAEPAYSIRPVWSSPVRGKAFVDFQNDVTEKDIRLAHQEGYVSPEHAKRYTTLGMATDQGKTSNVNGMAILADARGQSIPEVGTTRYRPPYTPVAIGAFAGHERQRDFQPVRRTAMHRCHEQLGALFLEAGLWLRPQIYPKPGEDMMEAIYRETKQVRETAGICDVSTLGKIEVFGADAAEFLNLVYTNAFAKLPVGKARYGLMLREDGHVFDDGTTSRLAEDHFFMTTTTANAARVLAHLEHHAQVVWPEMDVHFCSATEQWCGVSVAGPNARKVIADAIGNALDLSNEALPFMGVRTFDWGGVKARIFRISFSGELAYEINVPWRFGEAMWNRLMKAGKRHGMIPYGLEALSSLRIEKGHVAGNELNGQTTAHDLGLGGMMSKNKHFIGLPMSGRAGLTDPERPRLTGFRMTASQGRLRGGAHLVDDLRNPASLGYLTSVTHSPQIGSWIGLGLMRQGPERIGEKIHAVFPMKNETVEVEICSHIFFDPEGKRLHG